MNRKELFEKIQKLLSGDFSGIIKIKILKGKILWAIYSKEEKL